MDTLRPDPKQETTSNNQLLEKMKAEMSAWKKTRGPVVHIPDNSNRGRNNRR